MVFFSPSVPFSITLLDSCPFWRGLRATSHHANLSCSYRIIAYWNIYYTSMFWIISFTFFFFCLLCRLFRLHSISAVFRLLIILLMNMLQHAMLSTQNIEYSFLSSNPPPSSFYLPPLLSFSLLVFRAHSSSVFRFFPCFAIATKKKTCEWTKSTTNLYIKRE